MTHTRYGSLWHVLSQRLLSRGGEVSIATASWTLAVVVMRVGCEL